MKRISYFDSEGCVVGFSDFFAHTPQEPPSFLQCLQEEQFLHAVQSADPVHPRAAHREAVESPITPTRARAQRKVFIQDPLEEMCSDFGTPGL